MVRLRCWRASASAVGGLLAFPFLMGCPVGSLTINPGFAFFEILEAPSAKDVTGPPQVEIEVSILEIDSSMLPADFFDTGSDPLSHSTPIAGVPLGTSPLVNGNIGTTDTIMAILEPVVLPDIGSSANVPVKIPQLKAIALETIIVTYNGMMTEPWQLSVDLEIDDQVPGTMNIMRTGRDSGTATAQVPVLAKLSYLRLFDNTQRTLEVPIDLNFPMFEWSANPGQVNWPQGRTNMVPGLSRLPTLGNLFRRRQVEASNTELLLFITPTIVEDE